MTAKLVLLPGDGIGPEIVSAATRVLDAVGEFDYEERLVGGASIDAEGTALTGRGARGVSERRRGPARRRRRPEVGHHRPRRAAPRAGPARPAQGARVVREPAPGEADRGADRCEPVAPRGDRGHRPAGRPRAHRRDLLRRARARGRRGAFDTCVYTVEEIERIARVGIRRRRPSPRPRDLGRQGERDRDVAPVARDGRGARRANIRASSSTTCSSTTRRCSSSRTRRAST